MENVWHRLRNEKDSKKKMHQELWVWSGNTTITNCRQTFGILRKSQITTMRYQEDKQSRATSSLFPIEMIAKPEAHTGRNNNNESTT